MSRLTQAKLHELFVHDLGEHVLGEYSAPGKKPLLLDIDSYPSKLKVYLFNCTCPPGGRTPDEYKIQLILENQVRSQKCHIDDSDGRTVLIVGYAAPLDSADDGVYVFWDTDMHREAAFSANLQVSLPHLLNSYAPGLYTYEKRGNGERMVICTREHLLEGINKRKDWDVEVMVK